MQASVAASPSLGATQQSVDCNGAEQAAETAAKDAKAARCPPGLEPPPGLAKEEEAAGSGTAEVLEAVGGGLAGVPEAFHVKVNGLPKALLTEPMMQAVLQQAGLEQHVVGFTVEVREPCGEADISFTCLYAARHCVRQFHGCQWDPSGATVEAVLDESAERIGAAQLAAEAAVFMGAPWWGPCDPIVEDEAGSQEPESDAGGEPMSALSAYAPAFIPGPCDPVVEDEAGTQEPESDACGEPMWALSAYAPAFIPSRGALSADAPAFVPAKVEVRDPAKSSPGSDASTETGDSEDEKVSMIA